jgi:uncharacterized membrane protein YkvA (DUF1232 family)
MPLEITFTLTDGDLDRFQAIVDKARSSVEDDTTAEHVEHAARELIARTASGDLPEFVSMRMEKLQVLLDMIQDAEWQLSADERRMVLSALAYLCDPEDLIPDHIPGLGFLDDAIYAEVVLQELGNEVSHYLEFCAYREREEERRAARGEDIKVGREEWLADKRAALHVEMRRRRKNRHARGRWRLRCI